MSASPIHLRQNPGAWLQIEDGQGGAVEDVTLLVVVVDHAPAHAPRQHDEGDELPGVGQRCRRCGYTYVGD